MQARKYDVLGHGKLPALYILKEHALYIVNSYIAHKIFEKTMKVVKKETESGKGLM